MQKICELKNGVQSGFSLMESLVSLLILSLAVLGAAGMQIAALRTSQQSSFQTIALQLAAEAADKMRGVDGAWASDADNPFLQVDFDANSEPILAKPCYGTKADCDAASMAASEIYEIERKVKDYLPKGRIKICPDISPWDMSKNTFQWECSSTAQNSTIAIKIGWLGKSDETGTATTAHEEVLPKAVFLFQSSRG